MTRIVMVVLALCACGQTLWRETSVQRIKRGDEVFVVTSGQAGVYAITANDGETLRGEALRAWTFERGRITVRERETPVATARRQGWTPTLPERAPRELRVDEILFASSQKPPDPLAPAKTAAGGIAFLAGAVLVIAGLVIVMFTVGPR